MDRGVKVTFIVTTSVPSMSKGPLAQAAANMALVRLAQAYYDHGEDIIMATDDEKDITVDIQIINAPF